MPEGDEVSTLLVLLGAAALGLASVVILRAPRREAPTVVGAALLSAAVSNAVARSFGSAFAAFVGALVIGLVAHVVARLWRRPVWLVSAPGVLVLVPGSVGYRSLLNLIDRDVATSIDTGFQMFLTAAAIVFGPVASTRSPDVAAAPPGCAPDTDTSSTRLRRRARRGRPR